MVADAPALSLLRIDAGGPLTADPVWWAAERHLATPFLLDALRASVEPLIG